MENNSPEIKIDSPAASKLSNFWFYHKWHVIVAIFVFLVLLVCTLQMCKSESFDATLMYAGPADPKNSANIRMALNAVQSDGNDKENIDLVMLYVCSEEQIREIISTTYENGDHGYVDRSFVADQYKQFNDLIMIGSYSVCLVDPWLYDQVYDAGGFATLKDTLGYVPEGARDECSIYLSDTEFGQYYSELLALPSNTVLCLRKIGTVNSWFNKGKAESEYNTSVELFRDIIEFQAPEN